jgi:hypothetical protein
MGPPPANRGWLSTNAPVDLKCPRRWLPKLRPGGSIKTLYAGRPLFPDEVISRIQEKAKGMPAYINTLCRGCLLDAFTRKQELIDGENQARVLTDLS